MKVREVMTTNVAAVPPDASYKETVELLVERGISGLPVVDDGKVIGIVTEADLMSREAYGDHTSRSKTALSFLTGEGPWVGKAAGLTAGELMSSPAVTAEPDDDIREAARRMLHAGVKRLPVVNDGVLVGIVSRHDLLSIFHRDDSDIADEVDARLANPLYAPDDHKVTATVADGVVTLTGTIVFESERPVITGLAMHVPGVVRVIDEVTAQLPPPR